MASDRLTPTAPAAPDAPSPGAAPDDASADLGEFRIQAPGEILLLLRRLLDQRTRLSLSAGGTEPLVSVLSAIDSRHGTLDFEIRDDDPQLGALRAARAIAVEAFLDNIRLQFSLEGLHPLRGGDGPVLRGRLPGQLYRFQRRQFFRVRPATRLPQVRLQHPLLPELQLRLRVLNLSLGGMALLLPEGIAPIPAGSLLPAVQVELDRDARFDAMLRVQHVEPGAEGGQQLGLAFDRIDAAATRILQLYIDQAQKLERLLRKA
ncbi:MAG: flagellar regulator YcgR PilZN domain-containing protein [Burkholderiaceae bacterium]